MEEAIPVMSWAQRLGLILIGGLTGGLGGLLHPNYMASGVAFGLALGLGCAWLHRSSPTRRTCWRSWLITALVVGVASSLASSSVQQLWAERILHDNQEFPFIKGTVEAFGVTFLVRALTGTLLATCLLTALRLGNRATTFGEVTWRALAVVLPGAGIVGINRSLLWQWLLPFNEFAWDDVMHDGIYGWTLWGTLPFALLWILFAIYLTPRRDALPHHLTSTPTVE